LATTADGLNFTDLGAVNGLNDPTTVSYTAIRYTAPNGTAAVSIAACKPCGVSKRGVWNCKGGAQRK